VATTRTFQAMLNQYLPNELLAEELIKRDYILQKVEKDNSWKGGDIQVPFRGGNASSVKFGGLVSSSDVSESTLVRGSMSGYVEVWGTLVFHHTDLVQHDGKIPESTFLRILPDEVDIFMDTFKQVVSTGLLSGGALATVKDDSSGASGILGVDKVDRFQLSQKVTLLDGDTAAASYYVIAINVNPTAAQLALGANGTITLSATRGGAAANVSAYTVSQSAKVYNDGGDTVAFTNFRNIFLSSANGGSSTVHGTTKTSYPILQAVNVDGSSINASNILDKIFDAYTTVRSKAKGNANTVLMSYKHLGSVMKLIETQKGSYKVSVNSTSASLYGWTEINITSVKGELTIVGILEADDDVIMFVDWKSMKFMTNGFFQKRKNPDGREYYEVRNTTGYDYLLDVMLFGDMMFTKPGQNGILYGITNY
jgi:hypothetical protein